MGYWENFYTEEWSGSGTGCLWQWWSDYPSRDLKDLQMWHLGTGVSGGRAEIMVGLDDTGFQAKQFSDFPE